MEALYGHFSSRTGWEGLQVVYITAIIAILLCAALLVAARIQRARQRREEQAHDQLRQARKVKPQTAGTTPHLTLIGKRHAPSQRTPAGSPR